MYNYISAMAHNEAIYSNLEKQLNTLINEINSNGGKIWIQSKENKEHYYVLDGEVSINSYTIIK